ncbi:MAG: S8 family serine peptidase [Dokdonella sp.]|uniref:S8 family serine peptidase n=1 Tax=Dokdonella sp. TaxID=2291710 RepID=UPI0025B7AF71|nr:S8 family serine peptidase [Dokdonella sp.]MBX3701330.1 S8 family serine peptidase [Dokdonella sp.]
MTRLSLDLLATAIAIALSAPSLAAPPAPAGDTQALARALDITPERLHDVVVATERLLDGRELRTVKALDAASGDIVGRTFDGDRAVDAERVRAAAGATWRLAYGAMTPALLERMQTLAPSDRVVVDLWYVADLPDDGGGPSGESDVAAYSGGAALDAPSVASGDKRDAVALEGPPAGLAQAAAAVTPAAEAEKTTDAAAEQVRLEAERLDRAAAVAAVEAGNQFRLADLRSALSAPRMAMVQRLESAGVRVVYASDIVPSVIVEIDPGRAWSIARWPDVAILDDTGGEQGPSLDVARPTDNVTPINAVGYDGSGVTVAVVEGGRIYPSNPYMTVSQSRDTSLATSAHTTGVGGIIASTHGTHRGLASASTLISANGQYNTAGSLEAATDWGVARAQVLNHSWGFKNVASNAFNAFDRRLDYITRNSFRLNVHAAGNHGAPNCGQDPATTVYGVESPGRGYNTLTVGGYNDHNTIGWGDDDRYVCSASGWPIGDGAGGTHVKPEVDAGAADIVSLAETTSSSSPLSGGLWGTSFAAPAVSALAADLMEADSQLAGSPVAVRALMMVGALRSAADRPTIDGTASVYATENGPWWFQGVDASSFPRTYEVYARAGQRVRFAINWLSNVTLSGSTYSNDNIPGDLDLRAYRSDGTTQVASSISSYNNFELVDFYAPATDTYKFKITLFGSWSGSATPFAAAARLDGSYLPRGAWWHFNGAPKAQGTFFDIRPAEEYAGWVPYWRGVALRSATTADYDLELYDASWFLEPVNATDTFNRPRRAVSAYAGSAVDFIMVDGNHWPSTAREFFRVKRYTGSGEYSIVAANGAYYSSGSGGLYGPYSMDANTSLFVADMGFEANSERRITLVPGAGAGSADMGLALYRSNGADSATWAQGRSQAVATRDAAGAGGGETLRYRFDGTSTDYLGLAVYNKTQATTPTFYLRVTPSAIFTDGFDGN